MSPKIAKIGLNNNAEYVANLVSVFVNVQQCSLLHGVLCLHNDSFLTDII